MGLFGKNKIHEKKEKFESSCQVCNKKFKDRIEYTNHSTLHPLTKPCVKCAGIMKVDPDNMKARMYAKDNMFTEGKAGQFTVYECDNCGYIELYRCHNWL